MNIPGYENLKIIYSSKNSIVYKAHSKNKNQSCILKVINNEYPSNSQIAQFQHEFFITQKLYDQLPSMIIGITEILQSDNTYALVLEDFNGISLNKILGKRALPLELFFSLAIQLTEILENVHNQNVLHKDINPSNVIWNRESKIFKLIDFGISTTLSFENMDASHVNIFEGTLAYISPEQTGRMNRIVDYRSDFYSLGITFYEMLTGTVPFKSHDPIEVVHAHMAKLPPPPHEINPMIPLTLSNIILKLLNKNPEDRYQSTRGIIFDLNECQKQWLRSHQIESFTLATEDIPSHFQLSEKLYGRESQIKSLFDAYLRVTKGHCELTLVSGYSGVGKSALVNEIHKPIAATGGYFASGKCDQYKRNIPFDSLVKALTHFILLISSESKEKLNIWKEKINKELGKNGKVMTDVIPQLKQIIGSQPPLAPLNSSEEQNRFNFTFQQFIKALCSPTHPLTIFLDDLQWVDAPTLSLLERLLEDPQSQHLYLIGSFRTNEVGDSHILSLMLKELNKKYIKYHQIKLLPLTQRDISQLLKDSFKRFTNEIDNLAEVCFIKTQGNPFFLSQFLSSLYQEKLLFFNILSGIWNWDLEKIKLQSVSENVVEFMSQKILKLPYETQNILKIAACIGNNFDLQTLSNTTHLPLQEASSHLWPAMNEGLVIPENENYKFINENVTNLISYRFLHDKVRQSIYTLILPSEKKDLHRQIGFYFLNLKFKELLDDKIFEIVNQLNLGIDEESLEKEKKLLVHLNFLAGKKAKSFSAFKAAAEYFKISQNMLPPNAWTDQYDLTLEIFKEASECFYILGEENIADQMIQNVFDHARTALDKALILVIRARLYLVLGKYLEAIQTALKGLDLLGVKLSTSPSKFLLIKEYFTFKWQLGNKKISALIDMPDFQDDYLKMLMSLLQECAAPAYLCGMKNLVGILMLKQVNTTLKYGNNMWASTAYLTQGITLTIMGDLKNAYEFGKLSLAMMERRPEELQFKARNLVAYAIMIHGWNEHYRTLKIYFRKAAEAALQSGDFLNSLFGYCHDLEFDPDITVQTFLRESQKFLNLWKTRSQNQWDSFKIRYLYRANLCGQTTHLHSLSDKDFSEYDALKRMEETNFAAGISTYYIYKMIICYLYGDYQTALEVSKKADTVIESLASSLYYLEYHFYLFHVLASAYQSLIMQDKKTLWKRMNSLLKDVRKWAKHCPVNFEHHRLLMEAEIAKIKGRDLLAQELYDQAIYQAKNNGYIQYEALANELAANYYLGKGREKVAKPYLQEAYYYYQKWGASAKAFHLEQSHPNLFRQVELSFKVDRTHNTTKSSTFHALDFLSAIKASQAITREIQLDKLVEKMMHVVIENAGAQKGILLLNREGNYAIEAIAEVDKEGVLPSEDAEIPETIINQTILSKEPIILSDASIDPLYKNDLYLKKHQVKSVLCFPLMNLGEIRGIVYLENNLAINIFKQEHFDIINILSTQMAISINNAQFYKQLEEMVSQRTHELKETQHLLIQKEKMAYQGVLMTGIAHEIRNPLNFVINFSQFSVESVSELLHLIPLNQNNTLKDFPSLLSTLNSLKEISESIYEQGNRADAIVKRMIEHSTSSNQSFDLVNLDNLIHQAVKLILLRMKSQYPSLDVNFEFNLTPQMPEVKVIEVDLQRVLINLLENAYHALGIKLNNADLTFTPTIFITTRVGEDHFEILLKDNGIGIKEENFVKVFTPFFTTRSGQGVGLGLSLCQNIVEREHGGSLTFKSQTNEYTEFTISIPFRSDV